MGIERARLAVKTIMPVVDIEAAIDFYGRLGFHVVAFDETYAWVHHAGLEIIHLALEAEPSSPALVNATSGRGALALLRGTETLEQALWEGTIATRGSVEQLLVGAQALRVYLHGLIRCP